MGAVERLEGFIRSQRNEIDATPDSVFSHHTTPASSNKKVWTWGHVAQELIDYSRKCGPAKILEEKSRGIRQIEVEDFPLPTGKIVAAAAVPKKEHPHHKTGEGGQSMTRQQWWLWGNKRGVPRDIMDGLPFGKLSKVVLKWYNPKQPSHTQRRKEISPDAPSAPPAEEAVSHKQGN